MALSDKDLTVASQIAYYNITGDDLEELKKSNDFTLKHILALHPERIEEMENKIQEIGDSRHKISEQLNELSKRKKNLDENSQWNIEEMHYLEEMIDGQLRKDLVALSEMQQIEEELRWYQDIVNGKSKCSDWKLVKVRDDNEKSGMVGYVFDAGDETAVVAFRGTEPGTREQIWKDFVLADLGLLNSLGTEQQRVAADLMREFANDPAFKDFRNVVPVGHSLGGNLAVHAALTAPPELKNKISRVLSLDGPGYSQKYLDFYQAQMRDLTGRIDHYQWTVVGSLLNPVPGSNYRTMDVREEALSRIIMKHLLPNLKFDNDGNLVAGNKDILAVGGEPLSKGADELLLIQKENPEGQEALQNVISKVLCILARISDPPAAQKS